MQRARRPPTGAESGARIAEIEPRCVRAALHVRFSTSPFAQVSHGVSTRRGTAWQPSRDARLEARLNHAEVPRRSRAHVPPPAPASARMSPNLLPTGATAKRSAAEWALRGSWVGKKLGAPAAKCGRGCTASGGTSSYWPPGYATPPPNPPLCPVAASKQ